MNCIYFLQAHNDGPIKVGFTANDPTKRMNSLKTGCPWPVKLLGAIEGSIAQEKRIHLVLSPFRLSGEWFKPHPIVCAAVQEALRCGKIVVAEADPQPGKPTNLASEIIDTLGGNIAVAALTGDSPGNVSNWRKAGRFPSRKWRPMSLALEAMGIEAPPALWKMVGYEMPTVSPVSGRKVEIS